MHSKPSLGSQPTLVPIALCTSFEAAVQRVESWIDAAEIRGFGNAYLGFDGYCWVVLISPDLITRTIPF